MPNRILRSAHFKLTLLYAAVFSISVLVLVTFIFLNVRGYLESQARNHIAFEVAQLMGDYGDDGMDELRHDIHERIEASPTNRLLYAVRSADGRFIFDRMEADHEGWQRFTNADGHDVLVHATPLDGGYTLLVGADLGLMQEIENAIRNRLFLMLLFVLAVAGAGGWWVSRRFLARVDRLGRTAEQIGSGNLSARIALAGSGDDFDQLAITINRMLERIEQLMGEVKHVSTSIAHDLRTPLGHLRQKLETLQAKSEKAGEIGEAITMLDRALDTFGAILRIAEIESRARRAGFSPVDLSALLNHLADLYQPVAEEAGMRIDRQIASGIVIQGDRALLTQCFVNLIENALHHSKATMLTIGLGGALATIADNGQGVGEVTQEQLLQPFYRADNSRQSPGNGLGLSLVKAIAGLHDAQLTLADIRPGLQVSLRFPAF